MATINFHYPKIFERIQNNLYKNIDYYVNKLHDLIVEISNLKENIIELRRRIIKLEIEGRENKKDIITIKNNLDIISINL